MRQKTSEEVAGQEKDNLLPVSVEAMLEKKVVVASEVQRLWEGCDLCALKA